MSHSGKDPLKQTKQFYSHKWTKDWGESKIHGPASRHIIKHILELLKPLTFNTVFDVGCGEGIILNQIKSHHPNLRLAGSELVAKPLTKAQKLLPKARFYQNDITTKPPTRTKHDLVLAIDVLEHIVDDTKAMANLRKLSSKYLLIVVPLGPLQEAEYHKVGHVQGYSKFEMDWKLEQAGFKLINFHQWGFPFYNLYRILLNQLPASAHSGKFTFKKRLISEITYHILNLSLTSHPWGGRYIALYQTT